MHRAQRLRQRRQPGRAAERLGQRIFGQRDERIEVPLDQRPDDAVAEPFGCGIDRQDLAGRERVGLAVGLRQHHVFPR